MAISKKPKVKLRDETFLKKARFLNGPSSRPVSNPVLKEDSAPGIKISGTLISDILSIRYSDF